MGQYLHWNVIGRPIALRSESFPLSGQGNMLVSIVRLHFPCHFALASHCILGGYERSLSLFQHGSTSTNASN